MNFLRDIKFGSKKVNFLRFIKNFIRFINFFIAVIKICLHVKLKEVEKFERNKT